jgi:hypothetical protein
MHRVKPQGGSISNLRALDDSAVVESGLTFWEWELPIAKQDTIVIMNIWRS